MNFNKRKVSDDDDFVQQVMGNKPRFLTVVMNDETPEVYVRGYFTDPEEFTTEVAAIHKLSEEYETIKVYINSGGGRVDTLIDLHSALRKFSTIITIASGTIASAAFNLWCAGDIRVIQRHTWVMSHRESYFGGYSKTQHHKELAEYNDLLHGEMLAEFCIDVLTPEEIERAKTSEVYLMPNVLVERGVAIWWEEFLKRDQMVSEMGGVTLYTIGEKMFMKGYNGVLTPVEEIRVGIPDLAHQIFYNVDEYPDEWFEIPTEIYADIDDELLDEETEELLIKNFSGEKVDGESSEEG